MRSLALAAGCAALAACDRLSVGGTGSLASAEDSISYVVGYQIGGTLKQQGVPAKPDVVLRGVRDALAGSTAALTDEQMRTTVTEFREKAAVEGRRKDSVAALANVAEAEKFFIENGKKDGVRTTASGLQWKVLRDGAGPHPKPTNEVTVHYRGTLINGDEFDTSHGGEPVSFPLNRVIAGWTEAVQLMNAGAKYQFWIPAALGYGIAGSPPKIGPNAALVFEVELLSFK